MHHDQIVRIKLEYKKKLKLAPKSSIFKKRYERLTTRRDKSPFVISDDEDYEENPTKRIRVDPPAGDPSTSAQATCTVSSDSSDDEDDDDTSPNVAFYEKYCPKTMAAKLEPTPAPDNDATTLKTVCRLLIDFDIYLGHLPSFILLIFAQCLFLEKKDLHSVDEILLTQYNCDILNKVMQGMERKIATKKMPVKKVKAAKRLIIKISMLLKKGDAMRKGKALPDPQQPEHPVVSTNPFECYEGTDYELLDLSDRITVGLASKGNTLITKDDVAELINNFKKCYQLNNDDNNDDEDPDEDEVNTEPEVRARDYTKSPLPQVKSPEVIKDDRIAYFIQQVRAQCAGQNTDFTDNNLHELTQKFKTLPRKIQNHLLSYIKEIKDEDITKITTLNKFENMAPVEIQVQQLTVAPEEIPRSANHTPLEHEHLDLAPEALQVEELVEEIMQFENFADDLLRGDDDGQGSDDDTSEVEVIENERPEPVDVDDSDDNALDVEDSDEEVVEHGDELDEEAFMASDEELDDGAVDNPDEQEVQASDADEDSNAEIKDSDEDTDTDMDDEADDSDSDHMDADDDADDDSDMDDDDDNMNDDSDDGEDHEPTHQPEDEQDDESEEEEAEEQPDEPTVEQAEQPAGNQDEQPAVDQAPQVKEASKDSGEESDDDQPKESNRNYEYDSNDDGYDDAEVIAKMINLTTFEGPPKPQSFAMPLPSTSAPPKSLLYSLQKNMKKAFNAPQSSKDFFNGCQLQCNKETAKKLNYPYQNLTPIFRCKKPRFEELKPNMFNASIDNAQFKANDMYLHQLHANNDEVQDTGVKRANKRR